MLFAQSRAPLDNHFQSPKQRPAVRRNSLEQFVPAHFNRTGLPKDAAMDFHSSPQQLRIVNKFLRGVPFENTPEAPVARLKPTVMSSQWTHGMVAVLLFQLAVPA